MSAKKDATNRRSSGRTSVVSKALRRVDAEVRQELIEKRLASLEADNYQQETVVADDDFSDKESEDGEAGPSTKRRKPASRVARDVSSVRKVRDLDRLIEEQHYYYLQNSNSGNRMSIRAVAAAPSSYPAKPLCSVCGMKSKYTCTRCGMKYCTMLCGDQHKETRCLKIGM